MHALRWMGGLALVATLLLAPFTHAARGQEWDCNNNGLADMCDLGCGPAGGLCDVRGCGQSADCNGNEVPDECDVSGDGADLFADGLDFPEDIVPAQGDYPLGLFVPDVLLDAVFHVPPDGGTAQLFAGGLNNPIGAVFAPNEFGGQGTRLFVANENPPGSVPIEDISMISPTGVVTAFMDQAGLSGITGLVYFPMAMGGPNSGKMLATSNYLGQGAIYRIDAAGVATVVVQPSVGLALFTPVIVPAGFDDYAGQIMIGGFLGSAGGSRSVFLLNPFTDELSLFTYLTVPPMVLGVRQIAFSPSGWFAPLHASLGGAPALVVAIAGGGLAVVNQDGQQVAFLGQDEVGSAFNPRGMLFTDSVLLVSDAASGTLIRLTVDDFALSDCNGNGVPDECDLDEGTSADCTGNGIPDECEQDCDLNGTADNCEIAAGSASDCNMNGALDSCESLDYNGNGVPDPCELVVVQDKTEELAESLGLSVCNVYAQLFAPYPSYKLLSVGSSDISTDDPVGFYQHPFGGILAPPAAICPIFPDVCLDSFVTIGVKSNDGNDTSATDPSFDFSFLDDPDHLVGGWFNSNPDNDQGHPDENLQVIIAQLTVHQGYTVSGTLTLYVLLQSGEVVAIPASFECSAPPCGPGDVCDDGDPCTEGDLCTAAGCLGLAMNCADDDPCTLDVCSTGVCSNPPINCNDGNACTIGDYCLEGACLPGELLNCDDDDACTIDGCDSFNGLCVHNPLPCPPDQHCKESECVADAIEFPLDVRPGKCPNKVKLDSSGGKTQVVVVGTAELDVHVIDLASVKMRLCGGQEAVVPHKPPRIKDKATPYAPQGCGVGCGCHKMKKDYIDDVEAKFRNSDILSLDPQVIEGELLEVEVFGVLLDGSAFVARDCILVDRQGHSDGG